MNQSFILVTKSTGIYPEIYCHLYAPDLISAWAIASRSEYNKGYGENNIVDIRYPEIAEFSTIRKIYEPQEKPWWEKYQNQEEKSCV